MEHFFSCGVQLWDRMNLKKVNEEEKRAVSTSWQGPHNLVQGT